MGRRHRRTGASPRTSWDADHAQDVLTQLAGAYRSLSVEWMAYQGLLDERGDEYGDLDVIVAKCLRHSMTAAESLATVTPIWIPRTVNATIDAVEVTPDDYRPLFGLGSAGLVLFEEPLVGAQEVLPDGSRHLPKVDVDGVLWWPWPLTGPGATTRMMLAPLTRSRRLAPLRGHGWKRSTLVEVTCFDVSLSPGQHVYDEMSAFVLTLLKLGTALRQGRIRRPGPDDHAPGVPVTLTSAA